MTGRVLMVAGEPSGDAQAARLVRAMREARPELVLYGVGGERMREAGVDTLIDIGELSIMGISEVLGGLGRAWRCYRRVVAELRSASPPALVILVDFPDFNLRVARAAHRAGTRVLYYVSPQVWAWRRGRIKAICRWVDRMIVLFPFELEIYRSRGLDAHFVGHPLAEQVCASRPAADTRKRHGVPADRPLVTLLPGSRSKTVAHNLPVMLEALRLLADRAAYALACAPGVDPSALRRQAESAGVNVAIAEDDTYNLIAASDVVAVSSGTATVECALLGRPMVVVYRMSRVSFGIARLLVKVPHVAMPNILMQTRVVPELIQADFTPERLATELSRYLDSPDLCTQTRERLAEIRRALVKPGAARRAAQLALEMLE